MTLGGNKANEHIHLPDAATVVVVGGGPAGAFFAINLLKQAKQLGKQVDLLIFEKKKELHFFADSRAATCREGCNYCAGGISPKLADVLADAGLTLPEDLVTGTVQSLAVHGDWKSIQLPMPPGRKMFSVFRGSRPKNRPGRYANFDSYLLDKAVEEGARVVPGQVQDIDYSDAGKPVLTYQVMEGAECHNERIEADFTVFAAGVNSKPGAPPESSQLVRSLQGVMPRFRPPKVRKTLICELHTDEKSTRCMKDEVHFVQYGSSELKIEMSSLIPKGQYITVVLIGHSVDTAEPSENRSLVDHFLRLPHVRRLLPRKTELAAVCACTPNMTVGVAREPIGHRIAVIGDLAVSRLYKDGIYSAYLTASALAKSILEVGVDRRSLKRTYLPVVKKLKTDNRWGALVFLLSRITFSRPVLSRFFYQAVITERKNKPEHRRRLANVLWRIASGDDSYRAILGAMFHPVTIARIAVGGILVTIRNWLAELVYGLKWSELGRYPTGVPQENVEEKRQELLGLLGIDQTQRPPQFERMYTIEINAAKRRIWDQLGKFGSEDQHYFRPNMVTVRRTAGEPNRVGSTIRYDVFPRGLSFSVVLEKAVSERYLIYRVQNGFARDGVLAFDIEPDERGVCLLSIYVAFDFPRRKNWLKKIAWYLFRISFPAFVHDVVWNHALCKLKDIVEEEKSRGDDTAAGGEV
jgi:flavin-dependent dehydrogenase